MEGTWKDRLVLKFTSGRFILAIAFSFTYCYLALNGMIDSGAVKDIILVIVGFYFGKGSNDETTYKSSNKSQINNENDTTSNV